MKRVLCLLAGLFAITYVFAQSAKVQSAYNYMRNGEFDLARIAIDEAIKDVKTAAQAKTWFYRAAIYGQLYATDSNFRKQNPDALEQVIRSYQKAMELDPKNQWKDEIQLQLFEHAVKAYNEAVNYFNTKNYQAAYQRFLLSSQTYESINRYFNQQLIDTFATLYASRSALKLQKFEEAEQLIRQLQSRNIHRPEMYSSLAEIKLQQKDTVSAKAILDQAVAMFPNDKNLMIDQLNVYLFSGNPREAITRLNEAVKKDPDFVPLYIQLGIMYERIKDTAAAATSFKQAIGKDPSNFDAYYRLGAMYYNRAVDINNEMNKLDLDQQKLYDALKKQRDGYFHTSRPYLEKAFELNPKDPDAVLALKELYARLGMMDKSNQMKALLEELKK
ncbi:MAG: tetratricopeptide repeat protein [Chitinophagales bacterium]|nr:tetratricopeptide repeat protein [Chitinophagales bacterium]MDW8428210.1 tetratricopeptide repeat protein [Chitinophagales bacterium]